MKRLYALLIILIVIYIGINSFSLIFNDNGTNDANDVNESMITVGASSLPEIENFTDNTLNDTTISLVDSNKNMTILVSEIDNSQSISDIFNNFVSSNDISSTQTIDQNGVTTYLAYSSGSDSYNADIFFNKNGQNYCISGDNILSSDSDYFINHCKGIIDAISINSTS
ncbi:MULTISPECIES: hypothetical protein [Methanobrevibacter]|uniref:Uncharacterized protein n=1 Tax=Methanobrevibacter gottschalkii DSM 11977 TaxID=1122229 RepID=A0A3N5B1D8_9EURY|nr:MULTISPECIES: hypothetical protein [Methanobrevibacter]OED01693.1 hypothetical protein A9505_02230 [Methanobrevibacter sp. A27]RPF50969.1 hypothetical protein EDC42_1631 [Methanobrevibacter gottschalkii DSM 11977]